MICFLQTEQLGPNKTSTFSSCDTSDNFKKLASFNDRMVSFAKDRLTNKKNKTFKIKYFFQLIYTTME